MKTSKILSITFLGLFAFSCKKEENPKKETNLYNKGEITLQYDDSYINIAEALSYRYEQTYPETKINLKVSKEDQALEDLLNKKVDIIIMSRDLTEKERKYWNSNIQLPWRPSFFAVDAVCFIVHKNSSKEFITLEEIREMMLSRERKLIFEGVNTSNFNTVIQKLNIKLEETQFYQIQKNENIIKSLEKYPNHIGVISYNTISIPNGKKAMALRENIKILPIKIGNTLISPGRKTLKSQDYPFSKLLYFLTRESKFGLSNGFIRYSCTSIGQKIVSRQGLQPYFIFPRTVKINTQN